MPTDVLQNVLSFVDDTVRLPFNTMSGKPHTGVNSMNLTIATIREIKYGNITNHDEASFGTLNQWGALGKRMRKDKPVYPCYVTRGLDGTFIAYPIYRSIDMI